ncbi:ABC-transporter, subfamily G member 22, partial [Frankliniella occidentalis]
MVSEEQAPLLEGGGARRKGSGHSLHEGGGGPGSDDGGGGPPRDTILSPMGCERLVYSWSDVNVFSGDEQRGGALQAARSLWSRCTGRRAAAPHRKHILKSVFGVAYPGELLAIMGASGAGKTTLLNTLTFRSGNGVSVTGRRCVNGVRVGRNALAALSAYVQQDDLFIGTLTVREHLVFQALVRMDRHIPYARRMRRVDEVISELALSKCENTMIGIPGRVKGISGGEMKRLSFAS